MMRLFLAVLFFAGSLALVAAAILVVFHQVFAPELIVLGMAAAAVLFLWPVTIALFRPFGPQEAAEQRQARRLRKLDEQGALEQADFRARRAFEVAELEDEGMHYYIELEDGAVLFLSGQYLYDYAPDDEWRHPAARRFPCTEFTVTRDRRHGYVVDIACRGAVLAPEGLAPPFSRDDHENESVPQDGDILARTYDEIKGERLPSPG
jgi:hypothetical protein